MTIVIVDYGSGNLRSAAKAFERMAAETGRSDPVLVTADPEAVRRASRIVLPGQGAFADCRRGLDGLPGMVAALSEAVLKRGAPMFGICVGMQLLATRGLEHGVHPGLDWIAGEVAEMAAPGLRLPQMGWNELDFAPGRHPLLADVPPGAHVYFVHSYEFRATDPAHVIATTDYGGPVVAIVGRDNIVGTQFHPEKSQAVGLRLIANFLRWTP
ncbi:MAG: imidazole glycerol phosphate synthase subunit HisH [Alphaproteobacteria bacterium]|nr:imidazole glycerol phosphate synthase subunit HisH [Alphaproteobacteria bacterium]